MFDRLELSTELSKYCVSITPIFALTGTISDPQGLIIHKYLTLSDNNIILTIDRKEIPEELTLNILRKGFDNLIIQTFEENFAYPHLIESKSISAPGYEQSILTFEAKKERIIEKIGEESIVLYKLVRAEGVAGLDPDFNDASTLSKTMEVMAISPVDYFYALRKTKKL